MVDLLLKEAALTRKVMHMVLLNAQMSAALEEIHNVQPASVSSDNSHSQSITHEK